MNHPRVLIENFTNDGILTFRAILDMTVSYREILLKRLDLLNVFVANNTLESATALINEAGVICTPDQVNKVIFGNRGLIPSTEASLNGNNQNRPKNYSGKLTRVANSPYFKDVNGKRFVRGVVVDGDYPYKTPLNTYTAIRNCIEINLNLPRYIRHELGEGDHTVDRDEWNEPCLPPPPEPVHY
tara:strand:+ start:163 stop:717 length:555 start_codon:yes stop_codon:yes gene_type:complete